MTDRMQEEVNTSSFAQILGELRASTADLMWIKTERYLHRGVAYKPHLDADAMAHTGEVVRQKEAPASWYVWMRPIFSLSDFSSSNQLRSRPLGRRVSR